MIRDKYMPKIFQAYDKDTKSLIDINHARFGAWYYYCPICKHEMAARHGPGQAHYYHRSGTIKCKQMECTPNDERHSSLGCP